MNLLAQSDTASMTVWDFIVKGGPTMAATALVSLFALAVFVERLALTRKSAVIPSGFLAAIRALVHEPVRALDLANSNGSPIAAVLAAAIRHRSLPEATRRQAIADAGKREITRLRHRMRLMGAIPQVATMLGLLGTIFGMIKTFQAVAASAQSLGKTEMLAQGIFEAWANTAAGLLVAIPVLVAYHAIMGRIDARITDLDRAAMDWLEAENNQPAAASSSSPTSSPSAVPLPTAGTPPTPTHAVAAHADGAIPVPA